MRLWVGLSAGPYLAGVRGCVPRAARQAQSGLSSASRPVPIALRCEAAAHRQLTAVRGGFGLASRAALFTSLECEGRGRVPRGSPSSRRLRPGLRPAHSSLRCEAAAHRQLTCSRAGGPSRRHSLAGLQLADLPSSGEFIGLLWTGGNDSFRAVVIPSVCPRWPPGAVC